ncbi:MYB4R1 [Coprinopsis sp. MPI-PUGE-AT-0042]|nr:MYB4R1 [Coprinopsis sp. MPI-PUGE-AT-0042]
MASQHLELSRPKELAQRALVANQRLQQHLTQRAQQLEDEIQEAEKLLKQLEVDEVDDDPEDEVRIPGASKPQGFFKPMEYLHPESPFYVESLRRNEYASRIDPHVMNPKETDALRSAVVDENTRLQALRRQSGNTNPLDLEANTEGIDWALVAEKVSDISTVKVSPDECRIKWLGDLHPSINHSDWTDEETSHLNFIMEAARQTGTSTFDWVDIGQQLGTNRTPLDIMAHVMPRQKHTFNSVSDQALLSALSLYGNHNWSSVAQHVSHDVTPSQCMNRYHRSLDPSIKRSAWPPAEDARLTKLVKLLGEGEWMKIAEFMQGRTNDQCSERWKAVLNCGEGKNVWSEEEDRMLVELVGLMGKTWKAISGRIGNGKTGPSCRMRYNKLSKTSASAASTPKAESSNASVAYSTPEPHFPVSVASTNVPAAFSVNPDITSLVQAPPLIQASMQQREDAGTVDAMAVNAPAPKPSSWTSSATTAMAPPHPLPITAVGSSQTLPSVAGSTLEASLGAGYSSPNQQLGVPMEEAPLSRRTRSAGKRKSGATPSASPTQSKAKKRKTAQAASESQPEGVTGGGVAGPRLCLNSSLNGLGKGRKGKGRK